LLKIQVGHLKEVDKRVIYDLNSTGFSQTSASLHQSETAHLGVQQQADESYQFIGIQGATGRITTEQALAIADIIEAKGRNILRLTTKQTLILPWVSKNEVSEVKESIVATGLLVDGSFTGTIVACTGNVGCSYSATNTKLHAKLLRETLDQKGIKGEGVNIHFTGCPFSCAQAMIGDIGLLGRLSKGVECYDVYLGGGASRNLSAKKVSLRIPEKDLYSEIVTLLQKYESDSYCSESFHDYIGRSNLDLIFTERSKNV